MCKESRDIFIQVGFQALVSAAWVFRSGVSFPKGAGASGVQWGWLAAVGLPQIHAATDIFEVLSLFWLGAPASY